MNRKMILLVIIAILNLSGCSNDALKKSEEEGKKLQNELNQAKIENAKLTTSQEYMKKEIERLSAELKTAKEELEKVSKQRDELLTTSLTESARLKMLDERVKSLTDQIKLLETAKKTLEDENKKIQADSNTEVTKHKDQLSKAEAEMTALKAKLEILEAERKRIVEQAARDNRTPDTRGVDSRIQDVRAGISDKENEINKLKQEIEKLKTDFAKERTAYEQMIEKLKKEIGEVNVQTSIEGREVKMEKVMFASASTEITAQGRDILRKIGLELKKLQYGMIYIEGHTDSDRVVAWRLIQKYPTNWEFSVIRATNVVRFLVERVGVNSEKIIAAGRSRYAPVSPNTTREGKAKNRRIEIYIMPERKIAPRANIPR
jgi:chemotaxis protein MotB